VPDQHTRVFIPLGADLVRAGGQVVCGPLTAQACDVAIAMARKYEGSRILLTPTRGHRFKNVIMRFVMGSYIEERAPEIPLAFEAAPTFDTLGEIQAVAAYLNRMVKEGEHLVPVFIFEESRVNRTMFIVSEVFRHENVASPDVEFKCIFDAPSIWVRVYRELYEWRSLKKNKKKIEALYCS